MLISIDEHELNNLDGTQAKELFSAIEATAVQTGIIVQVDIESPTRKAPKRKDVPSSQKSHEKDREFYELH